MNESNHAPCEWDPAVSFNATRGPWCKTHLAVLADHRAATFPAPTRASCRSCDGYGVLDQLDPCDACAGTGKARRTPLNPDRKSGHIFTNPGETCWCGDEHHHPSTTEEDDLT